MRDNLIVTGAVSINITTIGIKHCNKVRLKNKVPMAKVTKPIPTVKP